MDKDLRKYFEDRISSKEKDECWEWKGYIDNDGMPKTSFKDIKMCAHRLSWILHNDEDLEEGRMILHGCKNKICVNPDHLYIGGELYIKKCENCGKEFSIRRRLLNTARFCSKHCTAINSGNIARKNQLEKWAQDTPEQFKEKMRQSLEKFFDKTDGCWNWKGSKKPKLPYGCFRFRGKTYIAHRASYLIYRDAIPKDKLVLHKCDNPSCVNPEHLWLGTHLDNHRDKLAKGRGVVEKLSIEQVKEIKEKFKMGVTGTRIARDYNISDSTASSIKRGEIWKDIE